MNFRKEGADSVRGSHGSRDGHLRLQQAPAGRQGPMPMGPGRTSIPTTGVALIGSREEEAQAGQTRGVGMLGPTTTGLTSRFGMPGLTIPGVTLHGTGQEGPQAGLTRRSRIRGRGLLGRTTDGLRAATPSFPFEHARASRLMLGLTTHQAQAGRRAQIRPLPVCCIPVKDGYLGSSLTTYSLLCKRRLCPIV